MGSLLDTRRGCCREDTWARPPGRQVARLFGGVVLVEFAHLVDPDTARQTPPPARRARETAMEGARRIVEDTTESVEVSER